jgi:hypothetical protein
VGITKFGPFDVLPCGYMDDANIRVSMKAKNRFKIAAALKEISIRQFMEDLSMKV